LRSEVANDLRRVFHADEPADAERRLRDIATAARRPLLKLEANVPEALSVLWIQAAHRRRLTITPTATRKTTSNTVYETA